MANAYSLLHNYDQPLFQPNIGLIGTVLDYKQNKLDTNRQQLQSAIDQFDNVDMIRDVDKDYANKRLSAVLEVANKYVGSDITDAKINTGLQSQVEQFMDDNVMSAIASTRLIRAEDAEWEQQRVKNPEKYADINRMYAAQARQPYLANQEVGAEYRGGGGFIEYTDINKLIQDNIIAIQKATESEYVETGAGEGYFRSLETKKVVDRGRMANAIDALFGEKEKGQLRINAWGEFSQASEDDLRQQYNQYMEQKTEDIDETLATLNQMKASRTDPKDLAEIQSTIDAYQRDKDGFVANNNFDAVMGSKGRTAVNNILYSENLKDNFLNAYSYEPITIKREVDSIDQANKTFQLQLNADARAEKADARAERSMVLKEQEFLLKQTTTTATKSGTANMMGAIGSVPVMGDQVEMSTDNPVSALKNYNTERKAALSSVAAIFGVDPKDSAKMLELQGLLSTDITEKSILKFNGKTIDLNSPMSIEKNRAAKILKFQMYASGKDPITKSLEKEVTETAFKTYDDLTKLFVAGKFEGDNLRNFGFKLVKSGDKFKVVDMGVKEAKQYQIYLMRKEGKLTESELETKRAYALAHTLMDSEINNQPEYKTLLQNTYNKFLMANVSKSDLKKVIIPSDHDYASNYGTDGYTLDFNNLSKEEAFAKKKAFEDMSKITYLKTDGETSFKTQPFVVSEAVAPKVNAYIETAAKRAKAIKEGDTKKADGYSQYMWRLQSEIKQIKRYNPAFTYTGEDEISEFTKAYSNVEVDNPNAQYTSLVDGRTKGLGVGMGETLEVTPFSTRLTTGLTTQIKQMNNQLEGRYQDLQLNKQVFTKDVHKELFSVIAAKIDQINPVKVEFERELNERGDYEGIVKYTSTNSKGEKVSGKLNESVLKSDNIPLSLGKIERNIYNAAYGEDAPIVNLGKGTFDNSQLANSEQIHTEGLRNLYGSLVGSYPNSAGMIDKEYSNYENGMYSFSLEPNGETYEQVMRSSNGQILHKIPTDYRELSDTDLQMAMSKSIDLRDGIFYAYMNDIVAQDLYRRSSVAPKQQNRNFTGN